MVKVKTKVTPVRYPGGKSNALKFLSGHFPAKFDEYREPFFGGGSVGLYLMQTHKDADYWINDLFYPVYCFWKVLYEQPETLVNFILTHKATYTVEHDPVTKGTPSKSAIRGRELHTQCRQNITDGMAAKPELHVAGWWYILNKTSYSGMSMIGSYAPLAWDQNFTDNCIKNLPKTSELMHSVRSVKITNLDYADLLTPSDKDTFIFLDPPYKIPHNLYGDKGDMHEGFDHLKFTNTLKECKQKWMITYNEDPDLMEWFKDHRQVLWDLQYTMKAAKRTSQGNLVSEKEKDGKTIVKFQKGSEKTGKSGKKGKELLVLNY